MFKPALKSVLIACAMLALTLFGGAAPASAQPTGQLRCESWNGQNAICLQQGIAKAWVVQLLGGRCIAGQDWGYGGRGISVTHDCRAIFGYQLAGYSPPPAYVAPPRPSYGGGGPVQCSSLNFQPARCPMDTRGGITIGMITNQPCIQGRTWGWDRSGVWVTGNCRAWFRPANGGGFQGGGPGGGYPGGGFPGGGIGSGAGVSGRVIECSSWQYKPQRCPAFTRNGVQIVDVIAGECVRNRTWGWDENGIWVNGGCRAHFRTN